MSIIELIMGDRA